MDNNKNWMDYIGRFWLTPVRAVVVFRLKGIAYRYYMTPEESFQVHALAESGNYKEALDRAKVYGECVKATSARTAALNGQEDTKESQGNTSRQVELDIFNSLD